MILWLLCSVVAMATTGHDGPHWGYEGKERPRQWGSLSPDFATCDSGRAQSPIDIRDTVKADLGKLEFDYRADPLRIINNGHTIQVNHQGGSAIRIGSAYPMEMHLVHKNARGELAVVGVFMQSGKSNKLIEDLWRHLPRELNHEKNVRKIEANPAALLSANGAYYHFIGSLTTPPCTEGVQWYVLKEPIEVSNGQVEQFVKAIGHNAWPVLPFTAER